MSNAILPGANVTNRAGISPWFSFPKPNPAAQVRLFCFPPAGAQASMFHRWPDRLPPTVEVCGVELPGHGVRFKETPFAALEPLVAAAAEALLPHLNKRFAFFGHSMGALLGFELVRQLRRRSARRPVCLFACAQRAPHVPDLNTQMHTLSHSQLLAELRRLSGTPEEILENSEVMAVLLPILRADFSVSETYVYRPDAPLEEPITVLGGEEDSEVSHAELEGWREHTVGRFSLKMLPGNHFFLRTSEDLLLRELTAEIDLLLTTTSHQQGE